MVLRKTEWVASTEVSMALYYINDRLDSVRIFWRTGVLQFCLGAKEFLSGEEHLVDFFK